MTATLKHYLNLFFEQLSYYLGILIPMLLGGMIGLSAANVGILNGMMTIIGPTAETAPKVEPTLWWALVIVCGVVSLPIWFISAIISPYMPNDSAQPTVRHEI